MFKETWRQSPVGQGPLLMKEVQGYLPHEKTPYPKFHMKEVQGYLSHEKTRYPKFRVSGLG